MTTENDDTIVRVYSYGELICKNHTMNMSIDLSPMRQEMDNLYFAESMRIQLAATRQSFYSIWLFLLFELVVLLWYCGVLIWR